MRLNVIIRWIVGIVAATILTVLATMWVFDAVVTPSDFHHPRQGRHGSM